MRQEINPGRVSYQPNSLGDNEPAQVPEAAGGYVTYPEAVDGRKVRTRGASFFDHYSQARMFFQSQSDPEKLHLIKAFRFELGKVQTVAIRERMVLHLAQVDASLADAVARGLGVAVPAKAPPPPNLSVPADGNAADRQHRDLTDRDQVSPALSMTTYVPGPIATRKVAVMVAEAFDAAGVAALVNALAKQGAAAHLIAPELGDIKADDGATFTPKFSILTASSVLFDAVFVAGGEQAGRWTQEADAIEFVKDAFKHCKTIGASGEGVGLLEAARIPVGGPDDPDPADEATIVIDRMSRAAGARFVASMARHRLWTRESELHFPA
jgi:catalase